MSNRSARPQGRPRFNRRGYEPRDANAKWIFAVVAMLLVAGLIMHFCLAGFMAHLEKTPTPADAWTGIPGVAQQRAMEAKDVPRLQISPQTDLKEFRAREQTELESYGWINRTAGVVRIPIDRAMELVLERGLPVRDAKQMPAGVSSYQLQQERLPAQRREGGK
jgi:hypothetical protein